MAYEYDLRALFRPQIDHLPLSEQLLHYHQRDLSASHLYRLGTGLFGGSGIKNRRRLIDASLYSPPSLLPHTVLLNRSLDGRPPGPPTERKSSDLDCSSADYKIKKRYGSLPILTKSGRLDVESGSDTLTGVSAEDFTKSQYQKWMEMRRRMRGSLEGLGTHKCWLLSKERTPMENTLLSDLISKGGKVDDQVLKIKEPKVNLFVVFSYPQRNV